jgi:hypothetical protein
MPGKNFREEGKNRRERERRRCGKPAPHCSRPEPGTVVVTRQPLAATIPYFSADDVSTGSRITLAPDLRSQSVFVR